MAATFLTRTERQYFIRKVTGGSTPTEPMNSLKRRHMMQTVGASVGPQTPYSDLEKQWLMKIIRDAGGTITNSKSIETLWKDAVIAIGQTPSIYLADNKIKFYLNAS